MLRLAIGDPRRKLGMVIANRHCIGTGTNTNTAAGHIHTREIVAGIKGRREVTLKTKTALGILLAPRGERRREAIQVRAGRAAKWTVTELEEMMMEQLTRLGGVMMEQVMVTKLGEVMIEQVMMIELSGVMMEYVIVTEWEEEVMMDQVMVAELRGVMIEQLIVMEGLREQWLMMVIDDSE